MKQYCHFLKSEHTQYLQQSLPFKKVIHTDLLHPNPLRRHEQVMLFSSPLAKIMYEKIKHYHGPGDYGPQRNILNRYNRLISYYMSSIHKQHGNLNPTFSITSYRKIYGAIPLIASEREEKTREEKTDEKDAFVQASPQTSIQTTLIHLAAHINEPYFLKKSNDYGLSFDIKDSAGNTPFYLLSRMGYYPMEIITQYLSSKQLLELMLRNNQRNLHRLDVSNDEHNPKRLTQLPHLLQTLLTNECDEIAKQHPTLYARHRKNKKSFFQILTTYKQYHALFKQTNQLFKHYPQLMHPSQKKSDHTLLARCLLKKGFTPLIQYIVKVQGLDLNAQDQTHPIATLIYQAINDETGALTLEHYFFKLTALGMQVDIPLNLTCLEKYARADKFYILIETFCNTFKTIMDPCMAAVLLGLLNFSEQKSPKIKAYLITFIQETCQHLSLKGASNPMLKVILTLCVPYDSLNFFLKRALRLIQADLHPHLLYYLLDHSKLSSQNKADLQAVLKKKTQEIITRFNAVRATSQRIRAAWRLTTPFLHPYILTELADPDKSPQYGANERSPAHWCVEATLLSYAYYRVIQAEHVLALYKRYTNPSPSPHVPQHEGLHDFITRGLQGL